MAASGAMPGEWDSAHHPGGHRRWITAADFLPARDSDGALWKHSLDNHPPCREVRDEGGAPRCSRRPHTPWRTVMLSGAEAPLSASCCHGETPGWMVHIRNRGPSTPQEARVRASCCAQADSVSELEEIFPRQRLVRLTLLFTHPVAKYATRVGHPGAPDAPTLHGELSC